MFLSFSKKDEVGHDAFLQSVLPSPGAEWELQISESLDAEWLGLHGFDDR